LRRLEALETKNLEKDLDSVTQKATGSITTAETRATTSISATQIMRARLNALLEQSRGVLGDIQKTSAQCNNTLQKVQKTNTEIATQHRTQLEDYGRIQANAGKIAAEVKRANSLFGFENYEDGLILLGKDHIEHLITRIIDWSRVKNWRSPLSDPTSVFMNRTNHMSGLYVTFEDTMNWSLLLLRTGEIAGR
jgi:hypothetical protein